MKKIYHDGKILHSQIRIGKNKKPIIIRKIRTMKKNSHSQYDKKINKNKPTLTDTRITKTGIFLRKIKIDEIPQIVSWIKGDLNLIGFRPTTRQKFRALPKKYKKLYSEIGPGLIGIKYAVPKKERNKKRIFELFEEFYKDFKLNKTKAYKKWGKLILKNIYK